MASRSNRRLQVATFQGLVWPPWTKNVLFGRQSGNHGHALASPDYQTTYIRKVQDGVAQRPYLQVANVSIGCAVLRVPGFQGSFF